MIITIDGTAGSGKSTAARNLSHRLGIPFLDTGATYRAVTMKAIEMDADLEDESQLAAIASGMDLKLHANDEGLSVILDGVDVSEKIRNEEVSRNSRYAASSPEVRDILVSLQRKLGLEMGSFVTEGRDQGSVVFPDADFKFFVDADPAERAKRRCDQLNIDRSLEFERVLDGIISRDESDRNRSVGPLRVPEGAICIDTSNQTAEETLNQLLSHLEPAQ